MRGLHRNPSINFAAFEGAGTDEQSMFHIQLDESSASTKAILDALPELHRAVSVLFDWIKLGEAIREKKVTEKAAGYLNEERYGKEREVA